MAASRFAIWILPNAECSSFAFQWPDGSGGMGIVLYSAARDVMGSVGELVS